METSTTASARGIRASGSPTCRAASTRRFDDGNDLRIGQAHVLAGAHHEPPCRPKGRSPADRKPRKVVQRRVMGSQPRMDFWNAGHNVVDARPPPCHICIALRWQQLTRLLRRDRPSRPSPRCGRRHRRAPTAFRPPCAHRRRRTGQCGARRLLRDDRLIPFLLQEGKGPLHGRLYFLRCDRFEFKHGGTAEQGVVDIKVGILGGGCDEGNVAVFNVLQAGTAAAFY